MSDELFGAKIALLVAVGIVTFVASLSPWFVAAKLASHTALRIIATASACSAGVVAGAFLCHLLPDANAAYSRYLSTAFDENAKIVDYPFAGMVCGSVVALLVIIDGLIVRKGFDDDGHSHEGTHDHITDGIQKMKRHTERIVNGSDVRIHTTHDSRKAMTGQLEPLEVDTNVRRASAVADAMSDRFESYHAPIGQNYDATHHNMRFNSVGYPHSKSTDAVVVSPTERTGLLRASALSPASTHHHHDNNDHGNNNSHISNNDSNGAKRKLLLRAWVFFIALSLHGIFDGLSVGSENEPKGFTSIVVAVASHKLFDGLSLGCAIFPASLPKLHRWLLLIISALTTPIGIGIGMAADNAVDSTHVALVNAIVLSLASGSFAYISLMELLPSSLSDGKWIPLKLFVFCLGFAGMAILAAYV